MPLASQGDIEIQRIEETGISDAAGTEYLDKEKISMQDTKQSAARLTNDIKEQESEEGKINLNLNSSHTIKMDK